MLIALDTKLLKTVFSIHDLFYQQYKAKALVTKIISETEFTVKDQGNTLYLY